jgi:hypothetical protein
VSDTSLARPARSGTTERRESRQCRPCSGEGVVVEDATCDKGTGELCQVIFTCPTCQGKGCVSVYLYASLAKPR